jgi:hypothetical protein
MSSVATITQGTGYGSMLEVDLDYPNELHDNDKDYTINQQIDSQHYATERWMLVITEPFNNISKWEGSCRKGI